MPDQRVPVRVGLMAAALAVALAGCGSRTLYSFDVSTVVQDEAGRAVMQQQVELCAEAVFEGDLLVDLGCGVVTTDDNGAAEDVYVEDELAALLDVRVTANVEGTALVGEVLSVQQAQDPTLDVGRIATVQTAFTAPRDILPVRITTFDFVGSVFAQREDSIPNQTGTLTVKVALEPGGDVLFTGTGPVTTDASAVYQAEVDVAANFDFPIVQGAITVDIDIDGYQGENVDFSVNSIDGSDPREVDVFMSF